VNNYFHFSPLFVLEKGLGVAINLFINTHSIGLSCQKSKTNDKRAKASDSVKAINSQIIKVSKRFQGDKRAI
jgi:hypothetical protein